MPDGPAEAGHGCRIPDGILDVVGLGASPPFPRLIDRGEGAHVWDAEGRKYVDWVLGKGPVTLGHAHPEVDQAAFERARRGFQFGLCSKEALDVADCLAQMVGVAERVIFAKNGSDVVQMAARLARAFTDRDVIFSSGYHGWHDAYVLPGFELRDGIVNAQSSVIDFAYDLELLERLCRQNHERVAAVLITPEPSFLSGRFLKQAADIARAAGALFVVDEVRCGFRLAIGGAHDAFGVVPDLVTLSKGLANGYPLAAVAGRADVLDASARTFIFGSYYLEALSLAASKKTLELYQRTDVVGHMATVGAKLMAGLDEVLSRAGIAARCLGPAAMFHILFEDEQVERMFFEEAARQGVLFFPKDNQSVSLAHGDAEVEETLLACARAAEITSNQLSQSGALRHWAPHAKTLARYERRRGIRPGLSDREHIDASWS
jgi:glutamate-1-semialdehyde 2,1-aminomutase